MNSLFKFQDSWNENISGWDTSQVNDFSHMFEDAVVFNQDLLSVLRNRPVGNT